MQIGNRKQNTQADVVELSDVLESDDFHFDDVPPDAMHSFAGNHNRPIDRSMKSDAFSHLPVNQITSAVNSGEGSIVSKSAAIEQVTDQNQDDEEEEEHREKMQFYSNLYTVLGVIIGVAAILVISTLLAGLINWLRYDILHSAFLLQNSL